MLTDTLTQIGAPRPTSAAAAQLARARVDQLTKPLGALGVLEPLVVQLAAAFNEERPRVDPIGALIFAADHGVALRGVSAYPREVTAAMLGAFARGTAAASVMARALAVPLTVWDVGVARPAGAAEPCSGVRVRPTVLAGRPSEDLTGGAALDRGRLAAALAAGAHAVDVIRHEHPETRTFVLGEIGIGNTTPAACVASALLGLPVDAVLGRGTGLDDPGLLRKRAAIEAGLSRLGAERDPLAVLGAVGGAELAAMTAAALRVAHHGGVVLVDGVVATASMIAALALEPTLRPRLVFAHASGDAAHAAMLRALGVRPLLELGMRLGEGTGALAAVPLLRLAATTAAEMQTFAEAAVPDRERGGP